MTFKGFSSFYEVKTPAQWDLFMANVSSPVQRHSFPFMWEGTSSFHNITQLFDRGTCSCSGVSSRIVSMLRGKILVTGEEFLFKENLLFSSIPKSDPLLICTGLYFPWIILSLNSVRRISPSSDLGIELINTTPPRSFLWGAAFSSTYWIISISVKSSSFTLTIKAVGNSPTSGSGNPITAASDTAGWALRRDSSSEGETWVKRRERLGLKV